jgi:conjugative relaxase-like TrwC/TraI family protein
VLSIGKMVARSEEYYIRTVAAGREEYYTGSGESPGYWLGEGARRLGLDGEVDPDDLRLVLAGVSPEGEILNAGRVTEAQRVSGFDFTWSAPKSVSLLYGLSDPGVTAIVRGIHEDAVEQALGYLERRALRVRRGAGGERRLDAHGFVAAAFVHRTSRAGDPQLHTHVLVANVAEGVDGAWSAPDARLLYHHARTAGFLYQAAIRAGLTKTLGVAFGPVSRGMAEVDGVPRAILRGFSTRRREIEHRLADTGSTSARAAEAAALVTRSAKDPADVVPTQSLRGRWLDQVAEMGLASRGTRGIFDHLLGVEVWRPLNAQVTDELLEHLVAHEGLTAHDSAFERRDVARLVAQGLPQGARIDEIEVLAERLLRRHDVVPLASVGRGGEVRHSTLELLALERSLLDRAARLQHLDRAVADPVATRDALARFALLSPEQVDMVETITSSGAGLDVVVGKAGAGKTLALAAARMSWESSGSRVFGTALSARAARGLRDGSGIESQTLARLFAEIQNGVIDLEPDDVIVVDEAGMVGTRDLARLIAISDEAAAKVVLVGDPRQLPEIAAGGALAAMIGRVGAIELTENRRQRAAWERAALDALRFGRPAVALATYERAGRIRTASTMAEAKASLVAHWGLAFTADDDALMLALGRREVAALNDLARLELRRSGRLGPDALKVDGRSFAPGDKVICLRNDRSLGVLNGTVGKLEGRGRRGVIVQTSDGIRTLPVAYLEAGHLGHAYAMTVHKAQGITVRRAFVLATEELSRESAYVAMSRATESTELFVPLGRGPDDPSHDPRRRPEADLDELTRRFATSRSKQLALFEADATEPSCDGDAPRHAGRTRGVGTADPVSAAVYGAHQASGLVEGTSVGGPELSGSTSNGAQSDIDRRRDEAQRRIAAELTRRGWTLQVDTPQRSWGLER